jgi:predicted HD phosphohydrolase
MTDVVARILSVFDKRGGEKYADEVVTQQEHALQCASFAVAEHASSQLVAAALLHDIGHILGDQDLPMDCKIDLDDDHERVGYAFLQSHFVEHVSEPIRLHVAAKRYLITTNPDYAKELSPTSFKSFLDQGGNMSEDELRAFESESFFDEAIQLRIWDDKAKMLENPKIDVQDFIEQLESSLLENADTV